MFNLKFNKMKTAKWIKGLIMLIGAAILPIIITLFTNGGHPVWADWQIVLQSVAGIAIMYFIKPAQNNEDPFGNVNWSDFWHGLITIAGGFVVGTLFPMIFKSFPHSMAEWWIVIGAAISAFGTYILKALFTTSDGVVTLTNPNSK